MVAAGVFAPGHLGELTWQVPFELADAVLEETRTAGRRLRVLPSRAGIYFLLALGLFPGLGYQGVWAKPDGGFRRVHLGQGSRHRPQPGLAGEDEGLPGCHRVSRSGADDLAGTGTRALLGAVFGPPATGETDYARQLLHLLDETMLVLMDAGSTVPRSWPRSPPPARSSWCGCALPAAFR